MSNYSVTVEGATVTITAPNGAVGSQTDSRGAASAAAVAPHIQAHLDGLDPVSAAAVFASFAMA